MQHFLIDNAITDTHVITSNCSVLILFFVITNDSFAHGDHSGFAGVEDVLEYVHISSRSKRLFGARRALTHIISHRVIMPFWLQTGFDSKLL